MSAEPARTLLLLRHAKSSWDTSGLDDHERPLEPRGRRAAVLLGVHLSQQGYAPDAVLCSSARRSVETLECLRTAWPAPPAARVGRGLYLASATELLARVRRLEDATCVLLIGHNPGLHELAAALAGAGDERSRRRLVAKLPTAALAALRFAGPWRDVAPGCGELLELTRPKDLV